MHNVPYKRYIPYLMIASILIISLYSNRATLLPLLVGTEVVLFPPLKGTITYQGKPAANAKVVVRVLWKDDEGETEAFYTDANGEFSIPVKKAKVHIIPLTEFLVTQQVTVFFQRNYIVWIRGVLSPDEDFGLEKYPHIRCELTEKSTHKESIYGVFSTSCKWDGLIK